jgi:hypothetical protein
MGLQHEKKSPGLPIEGESRKTGETKALRWRDFHRHLEVCELLDSA